MPRELRQRTGALLIVTLIVTLSLAACGQTSAVSGAVTQFGAVATPAPDTVALKRTGIALGAAVDYSYLASDTLYRQTLTRYFTTLVPENELKPYQLEPQRDHFSYAQADAMINFALMNGMQVRGAALVMNGQLPDWLVNGHFTKAEYTDILHTYITTVVSHFRGRIAQWDVVDEAVTSDGALRPNVWLTNIGPSYISLAFEWAHAADPDALLFYNDYGAEIPTEKEQGIYQLVSQLRAQHVPIQGVGFQYHVSVVDGYDAKGAASVFQRFAALGVQVAITELDVQITGAHGTQQSLLQQQATIYGAIGAVCAHQPACKTIVTWGVDDRYSWIYTYVHHPNDAPLLFDRNGATKPAYTSLMHALLPTTQSGG